MPARGSDQRPNARPFAHGLWAPLTMVAVVMVLLTGMTTQGQPAAAVEAEATDARPNAERPLTHEELQTIRGERERFSTWGATTLVAETVLERDRALRAGDEWSGEGPAFGALPRAGAHPGDPLVVASKAVSALYPADDGPVRGLLAISDSRSDALRLEGTVEMPAGTYLTPIETSIVAAADELPVGALIVVRGWLSSLAPSGACPDVPRALDPHDTGGRDSPFVRCPGGWLTADEVTESDPADPAIPLGFGIPVQSGALERHGRQADEQPVPGSASYLLRRVANPIDGATPARAWLVIGRLRPITVPDVAPPLARADIARPGGLDWQSGMDRQPPADGWSLHSTAWEGGFASVHLGRDRVLSSWVSSDGRSWESVELPTDIATVSALLPLRDGLVLIANELRFDEPWTYEVWRSSDGLSWRRVSRQRVQQPDRFDGYRRNVQGFWSLGDRIVALATYTTTPCCGNSSAWTVVANDRRASDVTFAWTSPNGRRWERQRTRGIPKDTEDWFGYLVTQGDGELLARWGGADRTIGRSTDGIRWRTIGHLPDEFTVYSPSLLVRTDDGFVLGNGVEVEGRARERMTFWRSNDAERWQQTFARFGGRATSLVSSGDSVIVAGNDGYSRGTGYELPWLMVSDDGGRTWDETLTWVGATEWCLESLTAKGSTVSLDAACATPDAASTYAVDLADRRPTSSKTAGSIQSGQEGQSEGRPKDRVGALARVVGTVSTLPCSCGRMPVFRRRSQRSCRPPVSSCGATPSMGADSRSTCASSRRAATATAGSHSCSRRSVGRSS